MGARVAGWDWVRFCSMGLFYLPYLTVRGHIFYGESVG